MTRTFQGPRKSSLLARSESFRRGHEVIHFKDSNFMATKMQLGYAWVWVFSKFSQGHRTWRSWVLKSSTKENMTWSKRTNSGRQGGFFSMRYKMYEATRCIYTVVCCNHLTSSWDLGPSSSTLKLTYMHLSNLAHLTMSLPASVHSSEEMTQCSRILAHFGTIVGSVDAGKLSKHGDVQEEAWTVQCQYHGRKKPARVKVLVSEWGTCFFFWKKLGVGSNTIYFQNTNFVDFCTVTPKSPSEFGLFWSAHCGTEVTSEPRILKFFAFSTSRRRHASDRILRDMVAADYDDWIFTDAYIASMIIFV